MQRIRGAKDPMAVALQSKPLHPGQSISAGNGTYHPTRWTIANLVLEKVDRFSGGRAGWVQRFISYGFVMHHIFTYRRQHTEPPAPSPAVPEMRDLAGRLGYVTAVSSPLVNASTV